MLGAAIVLPDHPHVAPESRGGMFDSTEIEEALLLHVQALSDGELEEIERQDPAVREMVARAAAATPKDIVALHGRVTLSDPGEARPAFTDAPPSEPAGLPDPSAGEVQREVDGVVFRKGGRVRISPGAGRRPARAHARGARRDDRADPDRLRRQDSTSGSRSTTTPARSCCARQAGCLFFFAPELEVIE